MNDKIFRKKSIDKMSSPEQLGDYVKVTNPGVWMVLAAIAVLLVGVCVWGVFGKLETKLTVAAVSVDGKTELYVGESDLSSVGTDRTVTVGGCVCTVTAVSESPFQVTDANVDEYTRHTGGLSVGDWVYRYTVEPDGTLPDGVYRVEIVIDSVSPLYFVFN